ncbi:MAG: tRNA pseudouridine(55) synthase TruB [Cytophagaceae bacterium]|nr:tRNA pseudouridine(55) synthase TruB [Cytophagaceae bacterium]MBK9508250.1 tRNA pseudouridine(55) synthase TruB [Cytophagaceae bacterium]MBK9933944.1 tRNA pseudouridine(55) synthase TruB [Cytophagaceae bacterium]MBL0300404.1 tRNA pseudouridine(55) synthase TruB [Cytophagaceae bacterium]MBL0327333.1 tRNA pseudouridine(55) synthase TruB [Cytophagaceae bacterium]
MDNPFNDSVLLIDKPLTWTSFDVVNKIRYAGKFKKVGHAGTLDPLATGLLILCTGKKTKEIETYQAQVKEYTGEFTIGKTTPSFDLETEVDHTHPIDHITKEMIEQARISFLGKISQIPPVFSAIKVNGKRAYESARLGKEIELKAREVEITEFEINSDSFPLIKFRVVCSKGTYIRSLARDFGLALQSGAYLSELRRTKIGEFNVSNAESVEEMVKKLKLSNENLLQTL